MELNKTKDTTLGGLVFFFFLFFSSSSSSSSSSSFGEPSENHIKVEKREIPESEVEGYIGNCEISLASKTKKKSVAVATLITTKISVN